MQEDDPIDIPIVTSGDSAIAEESAAPETEAPIEVVAPKHVDKLDQSEVTLVVQHVDKTAEHTTVSLTQIDKHLGTMTSKLQHLEVIKVVVLLEVGVSFHS